jgi:hypothetical protein
VKPVRALIAWLAWLLLNGCTCAQPGCTLENCRVMIRDCRVEFDGYAQFCLVNFPAPEGTDHAVYCVDTCNAVAGRGAIAQCIAGKAEECRDARDAGRQYWEVTAPCAVSNAQAPQQACADACRLTRDSCDEKCSGGRACDTCRRAGMASCPACPNTTFEACMECTRPCMYDYLKCVEACPRQ